MGPSEDKRVGAKRGWEICSEGASGGGASWRWRPPGYKIPPFNSQISAIKLPKHYFGGIFVHRHETILIRRRHLATVGGTGTPYG